MLDGPTKSFTFRNHNVSHIIEKMYRTLMPFRHSSCSPARVGFQLAMAGSFPLLRGCSDNARCFKRAVILAQKGDPISHDRRRSPVGVCDCEMTEGRRRGFEASSPKISLRTDHLASNGLNSSLSTGIDSPASASGRSANNLWGCTSQPAVHDVSDLVGQYAAVPNP